MAVGQTSGDGVEDDGRRQAGDRHLGQMAELGIVLAKLIQLALKFLEQLLDGRAPGIPELAANVVITLAGHSRGLQARNGHLEKDLVIWTQDNQVVKCLQTIPGIGIIKASVPAEFLEEAAIRQPANRGLQNCIAHLLGRLVGGPPNHASRY